jgi:hypothetical protein
MWGLVLKTGKVKQVLFEDGYQWKELGRRE